MEMRVIKVACLLAVALLGSGLVGCSASPKKFDVEVTTDQDLRAFTVPVDIIGVNTDVDLPAWQGQSVDSYFAAGGDRRKGANAYTMTFTPGGPATMTLSASDPKWDQWNKPTSIVIFAQIPQYAGDRGAGDQRRKVLVTMSDVWEGDKLIIEVRKTGLEVRTPQKKK